MKERTKGALLGALAALALGAVVVAVALAAAGGGDGDDGETVVVRSDPDQGVTETVGDSDDLPMEPEELRRAGAAAERIVGGGDATDVERSDDPGEAYEVEVLTDRGEVDVALDESLDRVPNSPYED